MRSVSICCEPQQLHRVSSHLGVTIGCNFSTQHAFTPLRCCSALRCDHSKLLFYCVVQETVWKQLPLIALQLGNKRTFKRYLEPFLDPLFRLATRLCVSPRVHSRLQSA